MLIFFNFYTKITANVLGYYSFKLELSQLLWIMAGAVFLAVLYKAESGF